MEIDEFQHPDFIWTWKTNQRTRKAALWLPYLQMIEKMPKGKPDRYIFRFNGGEVSCHLKEIDFIMLYGASGTLPVEFLDRLSVYKIPLLIHRRNLPQPYVFYPTTASAHPDIVTPQILYRKNEIRRIYIARVLLAARFNRMKNLIAIPQSAIKKLKQARTLEKARNLEAMITKRYWKAYYQKLEIEDINRRDNTHKINGALDAGSFFLFGVLLRWLLFHKLSPCHAFLHEPTSYPSLCYDLMEPYRYLIEESVAAGYLELGPEDDTPLTAVSLEILKRRLEEVVYVPETRQFVATKNLLHGCVLALRAYLLGEVKRLVLPAEGLKKGGRPPNSGYSLPGGK